MHVEGEKDADTVTNLKLGAAHKLVVGVTSGGATSWRPEFAKLLKGKNAVLMPDDDDAGEQYAAAVKHRWPRRVSSTGRSDSEMWTARM